MVTVDDASGLAGRAALYDGGSGEPEEVVITGESSTISVYVHWRDRNHCEGVPPESLTLLPETDSQVWDPVAASQACLNEVTAAVIRAARVDSRRAAAVIEALRAHNLAAGFPFEDTRPSGRPSRVFHTDGERQSAELEVGAVLGEETGRGAGRAGGPEGACAGANGGHAGAL